MSREKQNKGITGEKGAKGPPGVCPACGIYGKTISWDADTDVSTCTCGWSNGAREQIDTPTYTNLHESCKSEQVEEMAKDLCHKTTCTIKKDGGNCYKYCNAYIYASRAINAGYRKQSEWISVDERLPEECTHVIVHDEDGTVGEAFHSSGDYFEWVANEKMAFPTHWMPLPEPPKMKGGE